MREDGTTIHIDSTGADKPKLPRDMLAQWQLSIEHLARVLQCSVAFISQIREDTLEVLVASASELKAFQIGTTLRLHRDGVFCETTMGSNALFTVANAETSPIWAQLFGSTGIRSYVGLPVHWPDGEIFGSLCAANIEEVPSAELTHRVDLLQDYQKFIERDLELLTMRSIVRHLHSDSLVRLQEISHRAKNHFSILSNIIQLTAAKPVMSPADHKQILLDVDAKIRAMALLHDTLYKSLGENESKLPTTSSIPNLTEFFTKVVSSTLELASFATKLTPELDAFPTSFDERYIFDLALLLSELTTNTIKQFKHTDPPLHVSFTCIAEQPFTLRFMFRDNGPGFSDAFLQDPATHGHLGQAMLRNFTRLLSGDFRQYNDNGAVVEWSIRA